LSGDQITTLFLNYEWRRIVSEALQQYFDKRILQIADADIDNTRNKFQELLNDLYTPDIMATTTYQRTAIRNTNQTILNSTQPNAIIWTLGSYDESNPTRVIVPQAGLAIVSANVLLTNAGAGSIFYLEIRKNGATMATSGSQLPTTQKGININVQDDVVDTDYFEVFVVHSVNSTIAGASRAARLSVTVIPFTP
jgi:hypothetical protein